VEESTITEEQRVGRKEVVEEKSGMVTPDVSIFARSKGSSELLGKDGHTL